MVFFLFLFLSLLSFFWLFSKIKPVQNSGKLSCTGLVHLIGIPSGNSESISGHIAGVEDFVSFMAAGFAQELLVALLHDGVLVALAQRHIGVLVIESLGAQGLQVGEAANRCRLDGLTAAVYTAAGASHDLDEVLLGFAGFDLV